MLLQPFGKAPPPTLTPGFGMYVHGMELEDEKAEYPTVWRVAGSRLGLEGLMEVRPLASRKAFASILARDVASRLMLVSDFALSKAILPMVVRVVGTWSETKLVHSMQNW